MSLENDQPTGSQRPPERGQEGQPLQNGLNEQWGPWVQLDEGYTAPPVSAAQSEDGAAPEQFSYREHVSGPLPPVFPPQGPGYVPSYPPQPGQPVPYPPQQGLPAPYPPQRPGQPMPGYAPYPPYPGYPAYPGYLGYPSYPGGYGPWGYYPPQPPPKPRDGYQFGISIAALVCSILAILGGLACLGFLGLFLIAAVSIHESQELVFQSAMLFLAFAIAGCVGGGFACYHSIRGLLGKPSRIFKLPPFWGFLLFYIVVIVVGAVLAANGEAVSSALVTGTLIALAAIFPALTLLALGVGILSVPRVPTTWRRFTLAITSGGTLGIALALILEVVALLALTRTPGAQNLLICQTNPDNPSCQDPSTFLPILITLAVIAPLVEEAVKPLGVALLIGRVQSAAEAFVLGLSAGIGFNLVETSGYISQGYSDWLRVALERSGTGLLHGFGSAMVALGWYLLIKKRGRYVLPALGCWLYAVCQHALWNGLDGLIALFGPPAIKNWQVTLGPATINSEDLLVIGLTILFLVIYVLFTFYLRNWNKRDLEAANRVDPRPPAERPTPVGAQA